MQRILNTEAHSSTGVAPYRLILNNSIDLDRGLFVSIPPPSAELKQPLGKLAAEMLQKQAQLIHFADAKLRAHDAAHVQKVRARNAMSGKQIKEFPVNSYVLLSYPESTHHKGPPNKLMTFKGGPYKVISFIGPEYTILDLQNNTESTVHIERLSPFEFDYIFTDPKEVARSNEGLLHVARILQHRGDISKKKSVEFLIRWKNLSAHNDTWEPWKNISWNSALKPYAISQIESLDNQLAIANDPTVKSNLKTARRNWSDIVKRFDTDVVAVFF